MRVYCSHLSISALSGRKGSHEENAKKKFFFAGETAIRNGLGSSVFKLCCKDSAKPCTGIFHLVVQKKRREFAHACTFGGNFD